MRIDPLMLLLPLLSPMFMTSAVQSSDTHPDLSGTYNVATLTPLERPTALGDRATFTEAEATEIAAYWQSSLAKDGETSNPDRDAPPAGGVRAAVPEFEGAAGKVGGYNAFYVDIGSSAFKLDGAYRTSIITSPANGQMPSISQAGRRRFAQHPHNQLDEHENTGDAWWIDLPFGPFDHPEMRPLGERCILGFGSTAGPPALPVMYNNLKRIVQTEDYVIIHNEMNHDTRIIPVNETGNRTPDTNKEPKWLGNSAGQWEGNTLLVTTRGFRDKRGDWMGSPSMVVEERFSRIDDKTLRYAFTVTDPDTWESSWSGEYPWPSTDERLFEYACHEGNYSFTGILKGARVLEAEARSAHRSAPIAGD